MVEIKLVLVAIDLSDTSGTVMDYAGSLAKALNAGLLVVHVVYDPSYFTGSHDSGIPLHELQQRLEDEAHERLDAICQSTLGDLIPYEMLVVTGRPTIEINGLIRQRGVDCLVIGAHSTDKPEHQLFGSTAHRLLNQVNCPVFMIPPHKLSEFISHG